jgi:hypothetical protein
MNQVLLEGFAKAIIFRERILHFGGRCVEGIFIDGFVVETLEARVETLLRVHDELINLM